MATSPYFSTSNQYIKYDIHVDETAVDNANNTSTVRVYVLCWRTNNYTTDDAGTCYVSIDGTNYSQSWSYGQKPISYNSDTVMFDKTVTIPHDPDGKKTIYVSAYFQHNRFSSNSQGFNVTLTEIPRAATLVAAQDFQDTGNPQITYNNPAGSLVTSLQACISLDGSTASVPYRDIAKDGTTYTFNLTSAERNTLLAATPNSNTLTVYFIVKTVLSGQTFTSSLNKVMTVVDANPTITGATYYDTNATTLAITSDASKIIQNNSTVEFKFTTLTALKSATLASIKATINGVTQTASLSGSTQSNKTLTFGTINNSYDLEATIVLTDSRGNTATETMSITMLSWDLPTAEIRLQRKDNYYDETWLWVRSTISSLDGNNSVTIQYQYKEVDEANYGPLTTISDSVTTVIQLDNTKAYDFRIIVSDLLGSTTYNLVQQQGLPILFIDRLRRSVGIGTIPQENNMLSVDRRVSLKNTLQEVVADFWSTVTTGNYHSASVLLRDQNGNTPINITVDTNNGNGIIRANNKDGNLIALIGQASLGGGWVLVNDEDGHSVAELFNGSNGGHLWLGNSSNDYIGGIYSGANGGNVEIENNNGKRTGWLGTSGAGDGTLNLYDGGLINNNTINLSGASGKIFCNEVRYRNGLPELYDGSLSSGSTTFSANYSALVVIGHVTSGGSCISCTVPVAMLSNSATRFCIADETNWLTFDVSVSGSTVTLAIAGRGSDGFIEKVYGML